MATKYHLTPTHEVKPCSATISCRYGGESGQENHFTDANEAFAEAERRQAQEWGVFATLRKESELEEGLKDPATYTRAWPNPSTSYLSSYLQRGETFTYEDELYTAEDISYDRALCRTEVRVAERDEPLILDDEFDGPKVGLLPKSLKAQLSKEREHKGSPSMPSYEKWEREERLEEARKDPANYTTPWENPAITYLSDHLSPGTTFLYRDKIYTTEGDVYFDRPLFRSVVPVLEEEEPLMIDDEFDGPHISFFTPPKDEANEADTWA